jgi:hypothetical protein
MTAAEPRLTAFQVRVFDTYRRLGDWQAVADYLGVTIGRVKWVTNAAYAAFGVNGAVQLMALLGMTQPSESDVARPPLEPMLTGAAVGRLLGIHAETVRRLAPDDLPFHRISRRGDRRYRLSDVEAYAAAMTRRSR